MENPYIYALDFDGVICDSVIETGITGWRAACTIWNDMPQAVPSDFVDQFRQIRPVLETGYEALLAMRLLHLGETAETICDHFTDKVAALMRSANITVDDLKIVFGNIRDHSIAEDADSWVAMNPLFPGVADKLMLLSNSEKMKPWYIVTTKQERFIKQILNANSIDIADECIFGLDRKMSKVAVLSELVMMHPHETIYFVEDRLQTLINVATNANLKHVKTVFALWGYNTVEDKALAKEHQFTLRQLENFLE